MKILDELQEEERHQHGLSSPSTTTSSTSARPLVFVSVVATASQFLTYARVEATSQEMCVGIVQQTGSDAGFVARHAARAATFVDACFIPKVKFDVCDVLNQVDATMARKNHCVIVIAEGAGQEYVVTGEKDDMGHAKYQHIGIFLRDRVNAHLKEGNWRSFYIDPSQA